MSPSIPQNCNDLHLSLIPSSLILSLRPPTIKCLILHTTSVPLLQCRLVLIIFLKHAMFLLSSPQRANQAWIHYRCSYKHAHKSSVFLRVKAIPPRLKNSEPTLPSPSSRYVKGDRSYLIEATICIVLRYVLYVYHADPSSISHLPSAVWLLKLRIEQILNPEGTNATKSAKCWWMR